MFQYYSFNVYIVNIENKNDFLIFIYDFNSFNTIDITNSRCQL